MVREDQSAAAAAAGAFLKEGIAEFARGEFEGFFVGGGVFAGVGKGGLERQPEFGGGTADEFRIGGGFPAAQAMVEVADNQIFETRGFQRMQENHGIPAARHAHKKRGGFRDSRERVAKPLQQQVGGVFAISRCGRHRSRVGARRGWRRSRPVAGRSRGGRHRAARARCRSR